MDTNRRCQGKWLGLFPILALFSLTTAAWTPEGLPSILPHGYEPMELAEGQHIRSVSPGSTVLFTNDGSAYVKRLPTGDSPSRSLVEIDAINNFANAPSGISLAPSMQCQGCPSTDTRAQVTDTTVAPWDAIGLLARTNSPGSQSYDQCTGALIGASRQHVLTAAHCLVDNTATNTAPNSSTYNKITFFPSVNGDGNEPFAPLNAIQARVLQQYLAEGGTTSSALNYDFGLVTLASPAPVGTTALRIAAGTGNSVTISLQTAGYPADKPYRTMWEVACPNVNFDFNGAVLQDCSTSCNNIVVHDCLSFGGQSGSPIFSTSGTDNYTVRAVLTGALTMSDGTVLNTATELNSFVYNTIAGWYNEDITNGLPLAPPAPPSSDNGSGNYSYGSSGSWFYRYWYYIIAPIIVVGFLECFIGACMARSRRANAARLPTAQYPTTAPTYPVNSASNYGQYGPSYYNGYSTTGQPAYPTYPNPAAYPSTTQAASNPTTYQTNQYPTSYPPR